MRFLSGGVFKETFVNNDPKNVPTPDPQKDAQQKRQQEQQQPSKPGQQGDEPKQSPQPK